ncbi:hypothetical protein ABIC83_002853 [Roseateles asaccharophilus]|uniref:hypothetical protein n=1 Tax=Roseateles asaccharophilus TaxID=582607 RepID=UPI003833970D
MTKSRSRPFRLKPFVFSREARRNGTRYTDLNTVIYTGPTHEDDFDLVVRAIGMETDYGALMAYLFRRFGYPNAGWDDYKELAKYNLTTPEPDMYMRVVPYVGNTSSISIMFMLSSEGQQAIEEYNRALKRARAERMHDWIEATAGIPSWAEEWLQVVRRDWAGIENWRQAFPYFDMYERRAARSAQRNEPEEDCIPGEWIDWAQKQAKAYLEIEPMPGVRYRSANVDEWPEDDPMKRYAKAVAVALADLKTPVRVRDSAINAFGKVEDARVVLKEPPVAGLPSGAIGNLAPQEFAKLHGAIYAMGNGDLKRGLKKLLAKLEID